MATLYLPDDWTPEQAAAVADLIWSIYVQLMDALFEQYPDAARLYALRSEPPDE